MGGGGRVSRLNWLANTGAWLQMMSIHTCWTSCARADNAAGFQRALWLPFDPATILNLAGWLAGCLGWLAGFWWAGGQVD